MMSVEQLTDGILNNISLESYFTVSSAKISKTKWKLAIQASAIGYEVEAKKTALNLQNLGQLLIYCKLCNPEEAYLLSSDGLGSLKKVLYNLNREDLLDYGSGKRIKKIKVARWDITKDGIDNHSIVPKI